MQKSPFLDYIVYCLHSVVTCR